MPALHIDERERDTITAALRMWQDWLCGREPDGAELRRIAENGRDGRAAVLSPAEIDALIDRSHEA